jgi:hypothetical protein
VRILQQGTHQLREFHVRRVVFIELLLRAEKRILRHLEDAELNHGFGGNFDLLLRLWIEARARLPLLLHQLAKTWQDKFAVLFSLFVGERAERIEKCSSGSFVGLSGFGKCALKFCLGHLEEIRGASSHEKRTPSINKKNKKQSLQAFLSVWSDAQIKAPRVCQTPLRSAQSPACNATNQPAIPYQPTINHRPANDGGGDGGGSSRCHSNTLDSRRGDNKRAGSSNTHTRDRNSRHCNSRARSIPVPHPR